MREAHMRVTHRTGITGELEIVLDGRVVDYHSSTDLRVEEHILSTRPVTDCGDVREGARWFVAGLMPNAHWCIWWEEVEEALQEFHA